MTRSNSQLSYGKGLKAMFGSIPTHALAFKYDLSFSENHTSWNALDGKSVLLRDHYDVMSETIAIYISHYTQIMDLKPGDETSFSLLLASDSEYIRLLARILLLGEEALSKEELSITERFQQVTGKSIFVRAFK